MSILFFVLLLVMLLPPLSPRPFSNPFISFSVRLYTLGAPQPGSLPAGCWIQPIKPSSRNQKVGWEGVKVCPSHSLPASGLFAYRYLCLYSITSLKWLPLLSSHNFSSLWAQVTLPLSSYPFALCYPSVMDPKICIIRFGNFVKTFATMRTHCRPLSRPPEHSAQMRGPWSLSLTD